MILQRGLNQMPANLKDLRSRIKSVKSTQQITKAMKLVSAAKFGRAQHNIINARPYASVLLELTEKIANLVSGGCTHPLMNESTSKNAVILVLSSDRGLCGGYNASMVKEAFKTTAELESQNYKVSVVCVGKKAFGAFLRKRKLSGKQENAAYVSEEEYTSDPSLLLGGEGLVSITTPFDKPTSSAAKRLSEALSSLYAQSKIGKLVVVYSKFQSAMVQIPTTQAMLPLQVNPTERPAEPIFEPQLDDLLVELVPRYLSSFIFQALLEATASENGARMSAMDSATRNAKEMERKLQITYQRARQAAITNELIEIISGAEAL
jgi:F-type H+-transporting ATPase subunit gamma